MRNRFLLIVLAFLLTNVAVKATPYYFNAAGIGGAADVTNLNNWYPNINYTGTPASGSFASGNVYNITGVGSVTLTSALTMGGTLQVGDGANACTFTIPSGFAVTGTIAVSANATLVNQNAATPTLGTLTSGSTVTFSGNVGQTVPSKTYSNLTISNTGGAVATAAGTLTVSGVLTISASSTLNMVTFSLVAGITQTTTASAGSITNGSPTVALSGAAPTGFVNGMTVFGAGIAPGTTGTISGTTLTLSQNANVTSTATAVKLSFNLSTSGTGTLQTQSTVGSTQLPPTNYTFTLMFNGTGAAQSLPNGECTFTNIIAANSVNQTNFGGASVVNGVITIYDGCTLSAGNNVISGSFTTSNNSGTGTGKLTIGNTSATPITAGITYNFEVDYNSVSSQTVVAGNYRNLNTVGNNRTYVSAGTFGIAGVFTQSANTNTTTGTTFVFNGTSAQTIPALASYNNLQITNTTAAVTAGGTITLASGATLTVANNATLDMSTYQLLVGGTYTSSGTGTLKTAYVSGTNPAIPTGKTYTFTVNYYAATGGQYLSATYSDGLTLSNTSGTQTASGTVTVNGVLTIGAGSTLNMGTNSLVGGITQTTATSGNSGTAITLSAANANILAGMSVYGNSIPVGTTVQTYTGGTSLTLSQTATSTISTAVTLTFNFSTSGTGTLQTQSVVGSTALPPATYTFKVIFNGAANQTFPNGLSSFNDLSISNTGFAANLFGNIIVGGTLTINSTLNAGTYSITDGGSFAASGTGILQTACPTTTTSSPIPLSTYSFEVDYNSGASTQTIVAATYNNVLNTTGFNRVLSSTGTISIGSIFTQGSGSYTITGSTVAFTGTASQTIPAISYNNLSVTNTLATVSAGGAISVAGVLNIASSATLDMGTYQLTGAALTTTGTGTLETQNTTSPAIPSGRTWSFGVIYNNSTGGQVIPTATFSNGLTLNNTSGIITSSSITVNNGLNITNSGSTLDMGTNLLSAGASFSTSGSGVLATQYTSSGAIPAGKTWSFTVKYNSTVANQTFPNGTGIFTNLIIANTFGTVSLFGNISVTGTLTLTSGILTLGTYSLTLTNAPSGFSSTGYINASSSGKLILNSVGTGTVVLPIGTATSYTPLSFNGTTNAPNISVGVQSTFTHTPANATNAVALQWSILASTASVSNVTLQFNTTNQGSGFTGTGSVLGIYASSYAEASLGAVSGSNPFTVAKSSLSLPTGTASLYAIGNQYAFVSTLPSTPTIGTATASAAGTASITYTPSAIKGSSAISIYTVTSSPDGITGTGTTSPISVTGLTGGTNYTFTITATNGQGTSTASTASNAILAYDNPDVPTSVTAISGDASATVSFTEPSSNDGAAMTSYTITSNPGGITKTGTTSPITVTGLTNGTSYTFTVVAKNSHLLSSAASNPSNAVTPTATTTWNGIIWSAGTPTSLSTVVVASNLTTAQFGSATSIVKLTINSGATFTLTNPLSITGTPFVDNGTITGAGTITLVSSSAQVVSGNGLVNNITINNSHGVTVASSGNSLGVSGVLTLQSGLLTTNGNLIFKSTSIANTGTLAPYGVSGNTGTISGTVTVERYIPAGYRAYRDMASQLSGAGTIYSNWQEGGSLSSGKGIFITGTGATDATVSHYNSGQPAPASSGLDYSLNGNNSAFTYSSSTFNPITNTKVSLDPFVGYRVLVRGDRSFNLATTPVVTYGSLGYRMVNATTLRTVGGKLITGTVTYNTTNASGTTYDGSSISSSAAALNGSSTTAFSMIANPYVCPVLWGSPASHANDGTNVYGQSSGINGSFWYLDPTYSATGTYLAYNALTGFSSTGSSNTHAPTGYIQPGQAVFVQNFSSTSPVVVFSETCKAATSTKTSVFGTATPLSKIYISLEKLNATTSSYDRIDGAAIAFSSEFGNTEYGPQDAIKFASASDNLSITDKGKSLSIDGRLPATASDKLPIAISKVSGTAYQLVVDASNYTANGFAPYLIDSYRGVTTALTNGTNTISFTADATIATSFANRFTIAFKPTTLAVNSIVASASLNNKMATISWNTVGEKGIFRFEVEKSTDAKSFTKIGQSTAKNTATATYFATDNDMVSTISYYRIKAISEVGTVSYSNVAKVSTDNRLPLYSLYPNPLKGSKVVNVSLTNVTAGKYTVSITNLLGQKIQEASISHQGGSASHAITVSNALAAGTYSVTVRDASNQSIYQSNLSVQK